MGLEEPASGGAATPQVLERAFALLGLFDESRPQWTTTEAARELGLPVPTAHRLLAVLQRQGYLARDPQTKRFTLGLNALRLGRRAEVLLDISRLAGPTLERLAAITDEVALLTEVNQRRDGAVCRLRIESSQPLRLSVQPGRELPLYAGAMQKALLAFLPDQTVDIVCSGELQPLCRATITRPERLRANLDEVRYRGWAISYEETNEGAWGIAVPIVDEQGSAVAAIGLAAPRSRLQVTEVRDQLHALHEGAQNVADQLGLQVPPLRLERSRSGMPSAVHAA